MSTPISPTHFTAALHMLLDETFDSVRGIYLDKGDALFETLAEISPALASIPVGGRCATLAAQVKHTAFYLETLVDRVTHPDKTAAVDWNEIWANTRAVDMAEWDALRARLAHARDAVRMLIDSTPEWPSEHHIAGAIGMIAHTAYHLGEIRQALCTLRTDAA